MNRRQKSLLVSFVTVTVITGVFVFAMINIRSVVNKSEAMRAMRSLGRNVLKYRERTGALPPESYVNNIRKELPGNVRLGQLHYRAQWIGIDVTDDTVLAYVYKNYGSLLVGSGYIVLRLDGRAEWMKKDVFEKLLSKQQSQTEIELLQQQLDKGF